jgi:hypothetical protein
MSIDKIQAREALAVIESSRRRGFSLHHYQRIAPMLVIWGVAWLVADLSLQFGLATSRQIWPPVSLAGTLACVAVAVLRARRKRSDEDGVRRGAAARTLAVYGLVAAFMAGLLTVAAPLGDRQVHTIFGLAIGLGYALCGAWLGWRLILVGAAIMALSFIGFAAVHDDYAAYMAVVGGGGLLLGGLWLRKA